MRDIPMTKERIAQIEAMSGEEMVQDETVTPEEMVFYRPSEMGMIETARKEGRSEESIKAEIELCRL